MKIKALLSTTVFPMDGTYTITRLGITPDVSGIQHYIGHPDTKSILESLGAIPSESKLFPGLLPGESAIACSIKQGMSNRAVDGFNSAHQSVTEDMIDFRLVTRSEICGFCNGEGEYGLYPHWYCASCGATNAKIINKIKNMKEWRL